MSDDLMNEIAAAKDKSSIIMVVGVGGAGGNAVNHMWNLGIKDVGFMVCNTGVGQQSRRGEGAAGA